MSKLKALDKMQIALLVFGVIWVILCLTFVYTENPETESSKRGYQSVTTYLLIGVVIRYVSHSFGNILPGVNDYKITIAWVFALDLIAKFIFGTFGNSQINWVGVVVPIVATALYMLLMELDLKNYKVYDEEKGEEKIEYY